MAYFSENNNRLLKTLKLVIFDDFWQPIPQLDPVDFKEETHDQVLKSKLEVEDLKNKQGPTIEELSKMFYTTKHRWYPVGQ